MAGDQVGLEKTMFGQWLRPAQHNLSKSMQKYLDDLGVDLDPAQTRIINPHTVRVNTIAE